MANNLVKINDLTVTEHPGMQNREPRHPALLHCSRGHSGEINQLWQDLKRLALMMDGEVSTPKVFRCDTDSLSTGAANAGVIFYGRELIPYGWKQASLTIDVGVANTSIDWTAIQPGQDGNNIQIEYVLAGATAVVYNPATRVATVTLNGGTATANQVIAALAVSATAQYVLMAANSYGHTGAGVINAASAAANMTGGTGRALRRASLTTAMGGGGEILFEARVPGREGNNISVAFVDTGVVYPTVAVSGRAITINMDAGVTTITNTLAALRASDAAMRLVSARLVYGGAGAGTTAAAAAANLTNGLDGTGVIARAGDLLGNVLVITEDQITVDWDALGATSPAGSSTVMEVDVCGVKHSFYVPVVA